MTPLQRASWLTAVLLAIISLQVTASEAVRSRSHSLGPRRSSVHDAALDAELQYWQRDSHPLPKRQSNLNLSDPEVIHTLAATDPVAAAKAADAMPYIANNNTDGYIGTTIFQGDPDQGNQYPWTTRVYFEPNPATGGDPDNGWQAFPELPGFIMNKTFEIRDGAVQPFYINDNYDPLKIKRAILVTPGKSRDSWKYVNMVRNSLWVQEDIFDWGIDNTTVLMIGIMWANNADQAAGAVTQSNELVFHGSQWQSGGNSRSPALNSSITSYEAVDKLADWLFDKTQFPNLNQVVFVGHSMGGQMSQRYALLKKTKAYDANMKFWVGNPGSYAWLTDNRPYPNASCTDIDNWHYGLSGNISKVSKYARKDVKADKAAVIDRYMTRKIHYAYGLLDNGAGDTHCEAGVQGGNHLDRGSQYVMSLPGASSSASPSFNSWPSNQSASFVVGVSHQDYPMLSSNESLEFIFHTDWDTRYPDLTNLTNPGDKDTSDDGDGDDGEEPVAKPRKFATAGNKVLAYSLLGGSVGAVLLFFSLLPMCFTANIDWQEQETWEQEGKERLIGR